MKIELQVERLYYIEKCEHQARPAVSRFRDSIYEVFQVFKDSMKYCSTVSMA